MKTKCNPHNLITLFVIVLIFIAQLSTAQPIWSKMNLGGQMVEDYDKGYLFANDYLVKTDINGNERYRVFLQPNSNDSQKIDLSCLVKAENNSILAGGRKILNSNSSLPFVSKFNACKEMEWCRVFELPSHKLYCKEIISSSAGNYYCLLTTDTYYESEVYVVNIDEEGQIKWANRYCNTSTYDTIRYTHLLSDGINGVILSGTTAFRLSVPDFGDYAQRPFWIKIDTAGTQIFDTIFNPNLPTTIFRSGTIHKGTNGVEGTMFYGGGSGFFDPVNDGFYKVNKNDFAIQWYPLSENSIFSIPDWQTKAIGQISDNELILASDHQSNLEANFLTLSIRDTTGNILRSYTDALDIFETHHLLFASDNKILVSGTTVDGSIGGLANYVPKVQKFNIDFNGGEIDDNHYTYDSLCKQSIVTDTITIPEDCSTLSIPDFENQSDVLPLKVFPNPASEYVTIEIPEYSVTTTKGGYVTQQQFRPLNGEILLSVINLSGQIVKTEVFDASERNHVINVNMLTPGLYMLHLNQKGKFVAQGKVMVVR
jgi:hypothetical protein